MDQDSRPDQDRPQVSIFFICFDTFPNDNLGARTELEYLDSLAVEK